MLKSFNSALRNGEKKENTARINEPQSGTSGEIIKSIMRNVRVRDGNEDNKAGSHFLSNFGTWVDGRGYALRGRFFAQKVTREARNGIVNSEPTW